MPKYAHTFGNIGTDYPSKTLRGRFNRTLFEHFFGKFPAKPMKTGNDREMGKKVGGQLGVRFKSNVTPARVQYLKGWNPRGSVVVSFR